MQFSQYLCPEDRTFNQNTHQCVWFEFCMDDCVVLWVPIIIPDDSCWLFHCTQSSWVRQNLWGVRDVTHDQSTACVQKIWRNILLCAIRKPQYVGVEYMRLFLWVRKNRDVVCWPRRPSGRDLKQLSQSARIKPKIHWFILVNLCGREFP